MPRFWASVLSLASSFQPFVPGSSCWISWSISAADKCQLSTVKLKAESLVKKFFWGVAIYLLCNAGTAALKDEMNFVKRNALSIHGLDSLFLLW